MKKKNYPGMNGFTDTAADGPELLVMHRAFKEIFDDENDYVPEEDELDEKDIYADERSFD